MRLRVKFLGVNRRCEAFLGSCEARSPDQGACPLHLAVVTNYYPDQRHNSEYGLHLVQALREARPDARVSVVAAAPGPAGTDVHRTWTYGGWGVAGQICHAVRSLAPHAVLVNASFNSWGSNPANLAAFWAMHRLSRMLPTAVLLHYLPQTLPVTRVGYRLGLHHRAGIHLACRLAASAQVLAFTLERDRDWFDRHFKPGGTVCIEHGLLGTCGDAGWSEPDGVPTVLAFGYWGPGKNLEMVLRAVESHPGLRLVVAGASHPCFPGYLERLRRQHPSPRIRMVGYVPEGELSRIFREARVVVLPYSGDTGTSGVMHLAAQHGRALLMSDLPVLREESERLGLAVRFYADEAALGRALGDLGEEALLAEGRWNLEAMRAVHPVGAALQWWTLLEALLARPGGVRSSVVPVGS